MRVEQGLHGDVAFQHESHQVSKSQLRGRLDEMVEQEPAYATSVPRIVHQ